MLLNGLPRMSQTNRLIHVPHRSTFNQLFVDINDRYDFFTSIVPFIFDRSWPEFMEKFLYQALDNYCKKNPNKPKLGSDKPKLGKRTFVASFLAKIDIE